MADLSYVHESLVSVSMAPVTKRATTQADIFLSLAQSHRILAAYLLQF